MMVAMAMIQRRCRFPKIGRELSTVAIIIDVMHHFACIQIEPYITLKHVQRRSMHYSWSFTKLNLVPSGPRSTVFSQSFLAKRTNALMKITIHCNVMSLSVCTSVTLAAAFACCRQPLHQTEPDGISWGRHRLLNSATLTDHYHRRHHRRRRKNRWGHDDNGDHKI